MSKLFFISGFLLLCLFVKPAFSQEKIVFNKVVTWSWPVSDSFGGNGFYWWHYASRGVNNLGQMPGDDWTTPADYWNGTFYLRFEVISQPSAVPFQVQLGIWQDKGAKESVSLTNAKVSGGKGSVLTTSLGSPVSWYVVHPTLDFTRPEDFDRIGLVLWTNSNSDTRGCIPMAQGWSNIGCKDAETIQSRYFPMTARITLIACASGTKFSGWKNYNGATKDQKR